MQVFPLGKRTISVIVVIVALVLFLIYVCFIIDVEKSL